MNVTALLSENTCERFEYGFSTGRFAGGLFLAVVIAWVIVFFSIIKGVKSSSYVVMVTVPLPFILLLILMAKFMGMNSEADGKGISYYFNNEPFYLPPDPVTGQQIKYDPTENRDSLI
jgi:SNF family Na+-dependent transporter